MITLERLVELRADPTLQSRFKDVVSHVVGMLSNIDEMKAQFQRAGRGGYLKIDQEFLEVSEGLMLALYEEGRLAGMREATR